VAYIKRSTRWVAVFVFTGLLVMGAPDMVLAAPSCHSEGNNPACNLEVKSPELDSFVLFGAGLLGLASYAGWRRARRP
jgi:hypothetical protein